MSELRKADPERERMIAEAAYFRAERRGFSGGDPLTDWLEAEAEITARLAAEPAATAAGSRRSGARGTATAAPPQPPAQPRGKRRRN
jgi:hypothetical protein